MSTTTSAPGDRQVWQTMPGWGIAADLTPREVVDGRRMRSIRRLVAAGLGLLLLICVGSVALSVLQARAAEDSLGAAQERSSALVAQQGQYGEVVKIEADTAALDAQISSLMARDVDVATFLLRLRDVLPGSMSITSANVTLSTAPSETGAPAEAPKDAAIGTVTLGGSSQELADLATYVSNLERVDGVVAVLPESNARSEAGDVAWSVRLSLTEALHTHRYDGDKKNDGGTP